jgi:hypothetical protein
VKPDSTYWRNSRRKCATLFTDGQLSAICPRLKYIAGIGSLIGISLLQAPVFVLGISVYLYHGHLVQIYFCAKPASFELILGIVLPKSMAMIFYSISRILFSLQQRDAFLQSLFHSPLSRSK